MTTKVEPLGDLVRAAAAKLAGRLPADDPAALAALTPRLPGLGFALRPEEAPRRLAWWLVGQWLTGFALGALGEGSTFEEAEDWFYGDAAAGLSRIAPAERPEELAAAASPERAWALLPYLLDPLGPGTRRHVRREKRHLEDRAARKAAGIFYTPADLARWMSSSVAPAGDAGWSALDPACGSGVFLRAALAVSPGAVPYGVDLSPSAAEMAAFVVLASTAAEWQRSPWCGWQHARSRLATGDALRLVAAPALDEVSRRRRSRRCEEVEESLRAAVAPPPAAGATALWSLGDLFPALAEGADVLLCNPPYAALGEEGARRAAGGGYRTFEQSPPKPGGSLYLPFVELAWRLTRTGSGRAAVVLPLAVAAHRGLPFRSLRKAIADADGGWECSFFDRAPDALFGDDVKTRNAVLAYRADGEGLAVTELLRWTSRSRAALFASIRPVAVETGIGDGIPKLGTAAEARRLEALADPKGRLGDDVVVAKKVAAAAGTPAAWPHSVFVGATAYNWFNCLRDLSPSIAAGHDSETGFHALRFADDDLADAAYAVIASRLAFWLWRVESDAFHVGKSFLLDLPVRLGSLEPQRLARLAGLGREVWAASLSSAVVATNRGRKTVAFPPRAEERAMAGLDRAVAAAAGLEAAQVRDLGAWHRKLVVVDDSDQRRAR